ncbi:MAG: SCO family protein [Pseudorhodobacter sp.]
MVKLYAGLAAAATAALLGGTFGYLHFAQSGDAFAQCRGGQAGGGAIGGPFTLVDQTGATVTEAEVLAKPALVYFGYTFCPDVCPLDNARNAEAVDILEEMGHEVTPVFITVDPARDTVEVMADFAEVFHPQMIALTGSEEQVKAAAQAYKTYYRAQEKTDDYYLVDHSTFTYLMLPQIGFADFFKREDSADAMAERVSCFLNAA